MWYNTEDYYVLAFKQNTYDDHEQIVVQDIFCYVRS